MPGRSNPSSSGEGSSVIRTGTRWDHLGEVAGGIIGRQQRELLSAGRRNAVHFSFELFARERIHFYFYQAGPGRTSVNCVSL